MSYFENIEQIKACFCFEHPKTAFEEININRWAKVPKGVERGKWKDSYFDIFINSNKEHLNYLTKEFCEKYKQGQYVELDDETAAKILEIENATEKLDQIVEQFNAKLKEAENLASKYKLEFDISPAYGMGGYFDGEKGEWHPSSQSC